MANRYPSAGPVTLRTNLADHKIVAALKRGEISSDLVRFDFCGPKVANEGFKPMVRAGLFDAGELAIVTYLQARAAGKPLVLLPAVVLGGPLHHCIRIKAARRVMTPKSLEGGIIGIRSYTQTTCVWVHGILRHEYGVDPARLSWGVMDDSHLAEYADPPNCRRLDRGRRLEDMLEDGSVDAIVVSPQAPPDPLAVPLIAEAMAAAEAWQAREGLTPINHMFVVDAALSTDRPDVVRDIYRQLLESKRAAGDTPGLRFGIEPNRRALERIIDYAVEQAILPRRMSVEELFDDTTRDLPAA